ncbi:MAG: hypothetical protein AB1796_09000 [Bacillota bacterium]
MGLKQVPEETSHASMLIFLLLRYPQIFIINFNLAKELFRISFMLKIKLDNERYIKFRKSFSECLGIYKDMVGVTRSPRINRRNVDNRTLLQVTWKNDNISIEEVNLVSSLVLKEFHKDLIIETRKESFIQRNSAEGDERFELLPPRRKENEEENLFAFREAGRVYVFDK